jgi:predicted acylesterase/phospholipase RssA
MKRRVFLTAASAATVAAVNGLPATAAVPIASKRLGRKALILSGGGSLGAYQAGVIGGLAHKQGLRDGEPLDFDLVCGTSIGGLNGYFVATAQYSMLETLWKNIGNQNVLTMKHPYEKIRDSSAGILNRMDAAMKLGKGLVKGIKGIMDTSAFTSLLAEHVNPSSAVHIPFYVSTTNLTRQEGRMFVLRGTTAEGAAKQALNDELAQQDIVSKIRVIDDDLLRSVLYATAAIPLAFDPALIPRADGSGVDEYVDGGVTENVPINVARHCVEHLHVVLVDPPRTTRNVSYEGAVQIGLGVFQTMQYRILEYQVLWALAQSTISLPFDAYIIRPAQPLPGKFADFNDAKALNSVWQIGYDGARVGWQPFVPPVP